jgi:hypothetical protein
MTKEELQINKEALVRLRDAYSEVLGVFHSIKHYQVNLSVHKALFDLNRAILDLEECVKFNDNNLETDSYAEAAKKRGW